MINDYSEEWEDLCAKTRFFWIIAIGYVPVCSLFGIVCDYLTDTDIPIYIFAGLWMLVLCIAGYRCT